MSLTCSNCYRKLPRSRALLTVQFNKPDTGEDVKLSLKEAIAYMLKARPPERFPDDLSLCLPCNNIFITMLDNYVSFLKRSKLDSPVYKLLRCEDEDVMDTDFWPELFDEVQSQSQPAQHIKAEPSTASYAGNRFLSSGQHKQATPKRNRHRRSKNQGIHKLNMRAN